MLGSQPSIAADEKPRTFRNTFRTLRYFAGYAFYRRHFILFSLQHELFWESDNITVSSLYDLSWEGKMLFFQYHMFLTGKMASLHNDISLKGKYFVAV